jgi:tRNA-specific 2-thiouridylase
VLRTDPPTNTVVVGSRDELAVTSIDARGRIYVPVAQAEVKVRHRSAPVGASVSETHDGFTLELAEPAYGVACGQFAVLYDEGAVVGAGAITAVA